MRSRSRASLRLLGCVSSRSTSPGHSWQPGLFSSSGAAGAALRISGYSGRLVQQLRQLRDVRGDAPRLVARHQSRCRSPARLILEIDIRQRVPGVVLHDEAISSTIHGGGKRRDVISAGTRRPRAIAPCARQPKPRWDRRPAPLPSGPSPRRATTPCPGNTLASAARSARARRRA